MRDLQVDQPTDIGLASFEYGNLVAARPTCQASSICLAWAFTQNLDRATDEALPGPFRGGIDEFQKVLIALFFHLFTHLPGHLRSGRFTAWRISKNKCIIELYALDYGASLRVILRRFAREADNDVGRQGNIGVDSANFVNQTQVFLGGVGTMHCLENAIGTGLKG